MKQAIEDVRAFHQKFNLQGAQDKRPQFPDKKTSKLWLRLVTEEFLETFRAVLQHKEGDATFTQIQFHLETALSSCELNNENLEEVADGLADIIYVCIGMALSFGIPLEAVWDEVHRSNMEKVGGAVRADGKILKPKNWKPPAIKNLLKEAAARHA